MVGGVPCVFRRINHLSLEETRSAETAQVRQDAGTPNTGSTPWACVRTPALPGTPPLTFPSMMVTTSGRPPITLPRSATGKQLG